MFRTTVTPRFGDADGLGHINNVLLPAWFEQARNPLFRLFTPDLRLADWRLILARIEVEFVRPMRYGSDIEILTCLLKIGTASITVGHEAWQDEVLGARGTAVLVHYDFERSASVPIPPDLRARLEAHRAPEPAAGPHESSPT